MVGCYLLLFDAPTFSWLDDTPRAFFEPPLISLPYLVGGFLPSPTFAMLDIIAIAAIVTMTIGYRTRASTAVVLITRLVSTSFAYSLGKISHQIALTALLACMLVADWGQRGDAAVDDADASSRASTRTIQGVSLLAFLIAFGFITAGFDKAREWINVDMTQSGILSWYYPNIYSRGLGTELFGSVVPHVPLELLKVADAGAALVEVTGLLALLFSRRVWQGWLLVVTLLHLSNALFLNITFATQVVVYLAFVDLSVLRVDRLTRLRPFVIAAVVSIGAYHAVTRITGPASGFFLVSGRDATFVYDLYVCMIICVAVGLLLASSLIRGLRSRGARVEVRDVEFV